MDKEGLRLEIELLEGKTPNRPARPKGSYPADILLTIASDEVRSYVSGCIASDFSECTIRQTNDALEAFSHLDRKPASLIICELNLPYMTGIGLVKKLRSSVGLNRIPIVLISAEPIQHVLDTDVYWLTDPFSQADLKQCLDKLINQIC